MKRTYKLQNLECANCASHMENDICKLSQVNDCKISFMTGRMTIDSDSDDIEALLDEAQRICTGYEKECIIVR